MPLTLEHYKEFIEPIINGCEEKECHQYWSVTCKIRKEKETNQDKIEIINLFDAIFSYMLSASSPNEPFKPIMVMRDGSRSSLPDDVSDEHRNYLQDLLSEINDPELKARIADTLWSLKHGKVKENAETAIIFYIKSAENLLTESWSDAEERIERALRIYLQLGLKGKDVSEELNVTNKIRQLIEGEQELESSYLTISLVQLLYDLKLTDNDKYSSILERIAQDAESVNDYDKARSAWSLAAKLYSKSNKQDDNIKCLSNAAETYVKKADFMESAGNPSYMVIASFLQSAVQAYMVVPGKKDRKEELYKRLVSAQQNVNAEMKPISTEIDVSEIVKKAISEVSGKDLFDALYKFAFLIHSPKLGDIKKSMEEMVKAAPLSSMIDATYYDKQGRVVDKSTSEDPLDEKMHRYVAKFHRNFYIQSGVIQALQAIRLEHNMSLQDWIEFLQDHPFIPQDRIVAYAHGLFHGFHCDFLSAAHILIPQLDNSIRHLLKSYEKETSKPVEGGLQEESGFKQTLNCKEIEELLGEAIVFDLKGLLIEKSGNNLRHRICHGLMDDNDLYSPELIYLYWLTLHIILLPIRVAELKQKKMETAQTSSASES